MAMKRELADRYFERNNFDKARLLYENAEKTGHVYYRLAVIYKDALNVKQDLNLSSIYFEEAMRLLLESTSSEDVDPQDLFDLGVIFASGSNRS